MTGSSPWHHGVSVSSTMSQLSTFKTTWSARSFLSKQDTLCTFLLSKYCFLLTESNYLALAMTILANASSLNLISLVARVISDLVVGWLEL